MLATVSQTRSLRASFYYARALNKKEKGGQIVRTNGIPTRLPASTQIALMESQCNDRYKVKAINIVLSHSKEDKELLIAHPELQTKYLNDFLDEVRNQGVEIDQTMWAMMEHINTDCLHYHMMALTTKQDGTRLNTNFIGSKFAIAAYLASKKNGLHYAPKIEDRVRAFQVRQAAKESGQEKITQDFGLSDKQKGKLKTAATKKKNIKDSIRRAKSIEEANIRKKQIRRAINTAASRSYSFAAFFKMLLDDNIRVSKNDGEFVAYVNVTDSKGEEKERAYTFRKQLNVDMDLIDEISAREKAEEERKKKLDDENRKKQENAERKKKDNETKKNEVKVKPKQVRSIHR